MNAQRDYIGEQGLDLRKEQEVIIVSDEELEELEVDVPEESPEIIGSDEELESVASDEEIESDASESAEGNPQEFHDSGSQGILVLQEEPHVNPALVNFSHPTRSFSIIYEQPHENVVNDVPNLYQINPFHMNFTEYSDLIRVPMTVGSPTGFVILGGQTAYLNCVHVPYEEPVEMPSSTVPEEVDLEEEQNDINKCHDLRYHTEEAVLSRIIASCDLLDDEPNSTVGQPYDDHTFDHVIRPRPHTESDDSMEEPSSTVQGDPNIVVLTIGSPEPDENENEAEHTHIS